MDSRGRSTPSLASGIRTPGRRPSSRHGLRIQSFGSAQTSSPQSLSPSTVSKISAHELDLISPFQRKLRIISGTPSNPTPLRQVTTPRKMTTSVENRASPTVPPLTQTTKAVSEDPFMAKPVDAGPAVSYQSTPPPSSPLSAYPGSLHKDLFPSTGSKTPVYATGRWYVSEYS